MKDNYSGQTLAKNHYGLHIPTFSLHLRKNTENFNCESDSKGLLHRREREKIISHTARMPITVGISSMFIGHGTLEEYCYRFNITKTQPLGI